METTNKIIDRLLQGEKVEFKELGELLDYEQPTKYIVTSKEYSDDFKIPVLTAGQTFILWYTNETEWIYRASKDNPVIIFDDFTTSFHFVDFDFKVKSSAIKLLKCKWKNNYEDLRFLYFSMKCIKYKSPEHARHWISIYSKFKIWFPKEEIRKEIAKILDTFTELEKELEKELSVRKKQYDYYRNKLLDFPENSERERERERE